MRSRFRDILQVAALALLDELKETSGRRASDAVCLVSLSLSVEDIMMKCSGISRYLHLPPFLRLSGIDESHEEDPPVRGESQEALQCDFGSKKAKVQVPWDHERCITTTPPPSQEEQ